MSLTYTEALDALGKPEYSSIDGLMNLVSQVFVVCIFNVGAIPCGCPRGSMLTRRN
jgi:hypothetical protein